MQMLFDFLSICLLISTFLSLLYMLIDAQLCVVTVFMKSGLELRNIRKMHRRNEHESASMTMTTLYVTVMLFGWVFPFLKGCQQNVHLIGKVSVWSPLSVPTWSSSAVQLITKYLGSVIKAYFYSNNAGDYHIRWPVLTNVLSIEPAPTLVRLVVASEIIGNHIISIIITI